VAGRLGGSGRGSSTLSRLYRGRLSPCVAGVLVAGIGWLALGVAPAKAFVGDPMTLPENQSLIQSVLQDIDNLPTIPGGWTNPATGSAYTAADELTGMTTAEMAAGSLPALGALGTVAIGGATLYTSYKVFSPLGKIIARSIFGDAGVNPSNYSFDAANPPFWTSYCTTGCGNTGSSSSGFCGASNCVQATACTSTCNTASFTTGSNGQIVSANGTVFTGCTLANPCWEASCGANTVCVGCTAQGEIHAGGSFSTVCTGTSRFALDEVYDDSASGSIIKVLNTGPGLCGSAAAAGDCFLLLRTAKQMRSVISSIKDGASGGSAPYGGTNAVKNVDVSSKFNPPSTLTQTDVTNAEQQCGATLGASTGTAAQEACRAALNYSVDPTWTPGSGSSSAGATVTIPGVSTGGASTALPFQIPEPTASEAYLDYIARLRALGYLGSVTVTDAGMGYPSGSAGAVLNPKSVIGVKVGSGSRIDVYNAGTGARVAFDTTTAPAVTPGTGTGATTSVTIYKVPDAYDPLANGGTVPGGTGAGGGINFTPLTSLSLGCKFPYGFVCYAEDVTGWFNTTPRAPNWTIDVPDLCMGSTCYTSGLVYTVDLSFFDTYMSWMRDIMAVAIIVGAVYTVAARLLGFDAAGDPGEAMDEASIF
jgi:hypothetical protein